MKNELERIKNRLMQRPFCKTFICLVRREKLEDELLPEWFVKLVNWTMSE